MNPTVIALVALKASAAALALQGKSSAAKAINTTINTYHKKGTNINRAMKKMNKHLDAGELDDWDDVVTKPNGRPR